MIKTTIVEVAQKAGVSVATVSRVINGNYPVKQETRERVEETIAALGYIPNMQAKELTLQKSTLIGVVVPTLSNLFFPDVINGIEAGLRERGYSFLLSCSNNEREQESQAVKDLVSRNVAGIIVADPNTNNVESGFYHRISQRLPTVFINGSVNIPSVSSVSNDEEMGAKMALNYLLDSGHREILFVRGTSSYSYDVKERGYTDLMKAHGCFREDNILNIGSGNSPETVNNTTQSIFSLLRIRQQITAAFACNDLMAVGVLNACSRLGLRVPEDLSVIGFDNISLARMIEPKLTTVDQNMYQLGSNAAGLLFEKMQYNGLQGKRIILNNFLVKRSTVGPPAQKRPEFQTEQ